MILPRAKSNWTSPVRGFSLACMSVVLLPGVTLVSGCGRGDQDSSEVVEPPAPTIVEQPTDSTAIDPPGGIELPPGEIPPPTEAGDASPGEDSPGEGGIELPSDTDSGAVSHGPQIQYASWQEIEKSAKSTGKVTVVDLWALSCEPCLKEFPGMVRLHRQHGQSVACIAVNMDYVGRRKYPPESFAEKVGGFLTAVGASEFSTFISETPSDDIYAALEIDSLPAVIVYRADGSVAKLFDDAGDTMGFTYDRDIVPLVTQLVQK